jgi:Skp family chaperone for outer membrane proteins
MSSKGFIYIALLVMLIGVLCCAYVYHTRPKIAFINSKKAFDGFEMKKEYQVDYEGTIAMMVKEKKDIENIMKRVGYSHDSLADLGKDASAYYTRYNELKRKADDKQRAMDEVTAGYDNKIVKRMNEYMGTFAIDNGLQLLLSERETGTVLFVDSTMNCTDAFVKYMNQKYNGK